MNQLEDFSEYNGEGTVLRKAQLRLLEMLIEFDKICTKHNIPYFISGGTCLGAVRHGGFIPWDDDIDVDVWHTDYKKLKKILVEELPSQFVMQNSITDPNFYRLFSKITDKKSKVTYPNNRIREKLLFQGLSIDILPLNNTFSFTLKKQFDRAYGTSFKKIRTERTSLLTYCFYYPLYFTALLIKPNFLFLNKFVDKDKVSHSLGTKMTPRLSYRECFPPKEIIFEGKSFLGPAKPHEYLVSLYGKNYMQIPSRDKRVFHAEHIEIE